MEYPTVEEVIERLKEYPKETLVKFVVYDMGNVEDYPPLMDYYPLQNTIYLHPDFDALDDE